MSKKTTQRMSYLAILISLLLGILAGKYVNPAQAESWQCPFPEYQVGSSKCTSTGCKLMKAMDGTYGPWICDYVYQGPSPTPTPPQCPPNIMCDESMYEWQ